MRAIDAPNDGGHTPNVRPELPAIGRFRRIDWIDSTESTNTDLLGLSLPEVQKPRILIADFQTGGRGRMDRSWEMPPEAGLLMSVSVPAGAVEAARIPTHLSLAVVEVAKQLGVELRLKWPNDVLSMSGEKVAGLLAASRPLDDSSSGPLQVVCGIGCNVSWPSESAPGPDGAVSLESLRVVAGLDTPIDRVHFAHRLIETFDRSLDDVDAAELRSRYRSASATIGEQVRIVLPHVERVGLAVDVDDDGRLLVDHQGKVDTYAAGDVIHLRPNRDYT